MTDPFRFAFVNHVILKLSGIIAGNGCQKGEHDNTFQITQSVKRKVTILRMKCERREQVKSKEKTKYIMSVARGFLWNTTLYTH